jgi:GT2 family glycosyltransferase
MTGQKMNKKVAYIIVGWNNRDLLKECLDSINDQTYNNHKIFYIDNDSKDESVAYVMKNFPGVTVIEPGYNTGFAKGNNIGISQALEDESVEYLALINTDARIEKKWASRLIEFAEQKPKGALFQGLTLDYYDNNIIDSTHIYISHNGQGTQGGWRYYYKGEFGPKKVFGVNAAACLISRKFIEAQPFGKEVFDERMFMYLEDIDLSARSTIMGWDNYSVPNAYAYHMGSASSGKNPGFSLYMTFRNNSGMLYKNIPYSILLRLVPKIVRSDIETFRHLRRLGKKAAAWKMLRGRVAGLWYVPRYSLKRRKVQKIQNIDKDYLWQLMSKGY